MKLNEYYKLSEKKGNEIIEDIKETYAQDNIENMPQLVDICFPEMDLKDRFIVCTLANLAIHNAKNKLLLEAMSIFSKKFGGDENS